MAKLTSLVFINLVTPKSRAKHEPLFNKPASAASVECIFSIAYFPIHHGIENFIVIFAIDELDMMLTFLMLAALADATTSIM